MVNPCHLGVPGRSLDDEVVSDADRSVSSAAAGAAWSGSSTTTAMTTRTGGRYTGKRYESDKGGPRRRVRRDRGGG